MLSPFFRLVYVLLAAMGSASVLAVGLLDNQQLTKRRQEQLELAKLETDEKIKKLEKEVMGLLEEGQRRGAADVDGSIEVSSRLLEEQSDELNKLQADDGLLKNEKLIRTKEGRDVVAYLIRWRANVETLLSRKVGDVVTGPFDTTRSMVALKLCRTYVDYLSDNLRGLPKFLVAADNKWGAEKDVTEKLQKYRNYLDVLLAHLEGW